MDTVDTWYEYAFVISVNGVLESGQEALFSLLDR